jgi:hypothetical protein
MFPVGCNKNTPTVDGTKGAQDKYMPRGKNCKQKIKLKKHNENILAIIIINAGT